jgi:hypothetical protein
VPEFFFLGFQVLFGVWARRDFTRHTFNHLEPGAFQGLDLFRIVRKQAHFAYAESFQNLRRKSKLSVIGLKAEAFVGLNRVQAGILQFVGLQFCHQANAAAFLLFVDQDSRACLTNHGKSHFKLLPAVASQGVEDVAGQALRVDAHQRGSGPDVTHYQSDCFVDARTAVIPIVICFSFTSKPVDTEISPTGREVCRGQLLNFFFAHNSIISGLTCESVSRLMERTARPRR